MPQLGSTPSWPSVTQNYTVYANGSFVASDSLGDRFALGPLLLLRGVSPTMSLMANDTLAIQNYLYVTGGEILGNVSVSYSILREQCQPSGLKIRIFGTIATPSNGKVVVSIPIDGTPSSSRKDQVWFRNGYTMTTNAPNWPGIGFDWSDSAALNPSFLPANDTLTYSVGSRFSIDPTVIGQSSDPVPTATSGERKLFYFKGNYLAFYSNGYEIVCQSSPDGVTWSSPSYVTLTQGADHTSNLGMWVSGSEIFYALTTDGLYNSFSYRFGQLNGGCSVNWSVPEQHIATANATYVFGTSLIVSTDGMVYVSVAEAPDYEDVYRSTSPTTFALIGTFQSPFGQGGILLPLKAGKVALILPSIRIYTTDDSGSTWSGPVTTMNSYDLSRSGAVAIGDTVYIAASEMNFPEAYAVSYSYGSTTPDEHLLSLTGDFGSASISTDGYALAIIFGSDSCVSESVGFANPTSWSSPIDITCGEDTKFGGVQYLSSSYQIYNGTFAAVWTIPEEPYSIVRFVALPIYLDPAVAGQNSWSRPGLSPYESYFSQLDEYVSPGNGLLGISQTDLTLPGRGMDLTIGRVYSEPYAFASSPFETPFQYDSYPLSRMGQGWSLDFPWMGANYLHLTDGQAYPYHWSANGTVFEYHGATDFKLVYSAYFGSSFYTLYMPSGVTYVFGGTNMSLLHITDSTGRNEIRFRYGSNGLISSIIDTVGRVVTLSYDSNNHLSTISEGGRTWTYSYNGDELVSVSDPLGRVTQYSYAYNSEIHGWLVSQVTYPTGGHTDYQYTNLGVGTELSMNLVSSQDVYSSSSPSSLVKSTSFSYILTGMGQTMWSNSTVADGSGVVQGGTHYNFLSQKDLSRRYDYNSASMTLMKVTESDYDTLGRINETKLMSPFGAVLSTTEAKYDNWGNLIESTDDYGESVYYSYANTNSANQFSGGAFSNSFYPNSIDGNIRDALVGQARYQQKTSVPMETYYKYNSTGYVLETKELHNGGWILTDYAYDHYGNLVRQTDANGHTTYYQYSSKYDSAYLTQQSILVGGKNVSQRFAYDFNTGFQTSATDPKGNTTTYTYDPLGRIKLVQYPAVNGVVSYETYAYNDVKNTANVTDEDGHTVEQFYDGLGNLVRTVAYNGTQIVTSESMTYNWQNQVSTESTPAGNVYSYSYDYYGRQTKVTNPDLTYRTTLYDDSNNIVTTADENGNITQYFYDWNQRLTRVWEYYSGSSYYPTSYVYDAVGNLLSSKDPNGVTTTYGYDDLNRLVSTTYADRNSTHSAYDSVGNVASTTDARGNVITYGYDEMNRLTSVNYPNGTSLAYSYDKDSNVVKMADAASKTTLAYDARNRLTKESLTIGGSTSTLSYGYDGAGNVVSMTYPDGYAVSMTYDALNRLKTLGSYATLSYTPDSQVASIRYGDGQVATYTYTTRDQPKRILVTLGATKQLDLNYTYDKAGNVKTIDNEKYGYDALDRLSSSTGPWGSIIYTYDAAGNRLKMIQGSSTTKYSYNGVDELTRAGGTTYSYDADGNLVRSVSGGTTIKYAYDYENNLISVTKVVGTTSTLLQKNVFDGMGRRIEQVAGSAKTVYMYQGTNIVYYKAGSAVTKVFYADGMEIAKMTGSSTYYYHQDLLGSVRLESTSSGSAYFSSNYEPYGPQYGSAGSDTFRYTGMPYDTATNLYYFNARFYDPTTGRFLTRDPGSASAGDPQSLNPYIYALDNPLSFVDPSGRMSLTTIGLWATAILLTVTAIAQGGLDVPNDVLDAAMISDAIASAAATAVAAATSDATGSGFDTALVNKGVSMATTDFADFLLTNAETGEQVLLENVPTIREGSGGYGIGEFGENLLRRLIPNADFHPDIWTGRYFFEGDFAFENLGIDSKVGSSFSSIQLGEYADAVTFGKGGGTVSSGTVIRAAHYFFFESPSSGLMVDPNDLAELRSKGVTWVVYFVDQL